MNEIVIEIIKEINKKIEENKNYLTDLDRAIGDGDHGVNISRGFRKLAEDSDTYMNLNLSELFNKIAMTLISNVGGASGALYGTAFMKIGMFCKNKEIFSKEDIQLALEEGIKGIESRGKSQVGEKTMLDTLVPFNKALKSHIEVSSKIFEAFELSLIEAKNGKDSTIDIIATKGRASYLKERSLGHLDPGATSSYLMLETITEVLKGANL